MDRYLEPQHQKLMVRVGLFGIGLDIYWDQFDGLLNRLEGYLKVVESRLQRQDIEIVNLGMIDTIKKSHRAGHEFRKQDVDLIFIHSTTYALSSTVLPVVQRAKVPVILLNISPEKSIDYSSFNQLSDRTAMTGEWLAHCGACPIPEIANVFRRSGIKFFQITGYLEGDEELWNEISEWVDAARVQHAMSHNILGLMGHYYSGMLDIYTDITLQQAIFGGSFEIIEVDELSELRDFVTESEITQRLLDFKELFDVQFDCSGEELIKAARTSVALEKLTAKYDLGSLAYYYKGIGVKANAEAIASIILGTSKLTAEGVPVAGEFEIKNVQAMKILDTLGVGGSFTEYYALDFEDDVVLMGHDGPGHVKIAEGRTKVKPLEVYHGKVGKGLSVEMSVKHGPVTLLSVIESQSTLKFLVAEGESVPGPILEIGNTNSRYKFPIGIRNFVNDWNSHGPAHHCAVGVSHIASVIKKLGRLVGIETIQVC